MVAVRVWDLAGQFPLGVQTVSISVLAKAEELAHARGAVKVDGQIRVALRDLDLAQVEPKDSDWVQGLERESSLPQGYRLDSEQGLVRDLVEVNEFELG